MDVRRRERYEKKSIYDTGSSEEDEDTTDADTPTPAKKPPTQRAQPSSACLQGTDAPAQHRRHPPPDSASSDGDDRVPRKASPTARAAKTSINLASKKDASSSSSSSSSSDDQVGPRFRPGGALRRFVPRRRPGHFCTGASARPRPRARAASSSPEPEGASGGRAGKGKPARELSIVEKHVRAMMNRRAEEQLEQVRLRQRAEALRVAGEAALAALGDLDEDSDSECDSDAEAANGVGAGGGAMGRARRRGRREGKFSDTTEDEVSVRPMTAAELGMAYAWMRRDQRRYDGATKFWDNAGEGIQECFEDKTPPGDSSVHAAVGAWPRLTGAFAARLGPAPVGFVMLKDDGLTVDAMGIRQGLRRMGLGKRVARMLIERARDAAKQGVGPPEYLIDAVPGAVAFWTNLGFVITSGRDSPTTAVMRRMCNDTAMVYKLLDDPPQPKGDEWWMKKIRMGCGGGGLGATKGKGGCSSSDSD